MASTGSIPAHYNLAHCLAWSAGALLSFTAMAVSLREASAVLSAFEMLALRNFAGMLVLLSIALWNPKLRAQLPIRRPFLHVVRNVCHFVGQFTWVQAVLTLPLATAFALEFTSPIWLALLAALLLGERLTPSRIVAIAAGFLGILVILRPGFAVVRPEALYPLIAAIAFAVTTVATKRLTDTETTFAILFWMNVIQLPLNLIGSDPSFVSKIPSAPLLPVLGVCVAGLLAHFCITNAYRTGDTLTVVPLDYLRLPMVAVIGALFYAEPLDPLVLTGAGIIIAGVLYNVWAESRQTATS